MTVFNGVTILIRIEILFPTVSLCKRQRLLSVLYHFQTESGETCVTPATERPQQQKEIELAEGGRCSSQLLSPQSKINVVPVNSRPVSTALVAWLLVLVVIIFLFFSIICCHCLCWFASPAPGSLPSDDPHVFHLSPHPSSPSEYLSPCAHKTSTSCAPSEFLVGFSVLSSPSLCASILFLSLHLPCLCSLLSFKTFLCVLVLNLHITCLNYSNNLSI